MEHSQVDIENMVGAWLAGLHTDANDAHHPHGKWADDLLFEWTYAGEAERLWQFVCAAYKREMPMEDFAVLAAGPLEDLLAKFGPEYIDRIEDLARRDPRFNKLLGGVWKNTMTDEVWRRVQEVRTEMW